MDRVNKIIEEIELDYLEFVTKNIEQRKNLLPITDKDKIKALIWNLLTSKKYRSQISYKDFNQILEVWFKRLNQ